ncbi:MAG: hypothetical protein GT601_15425 [Acidaminobacter sp.]|uniref:MBL fold metallo-hydrolase n=1 Tax=Acidaminobacter sp. TaxID=1872102 RepID=UPI0013801D6C|nr:MBL fold metallo-hydrolase [Acidaminobacter sp.]MZQ99056.1 hypothetical protein [Acidaminobacter sp.]
MQRSLHSQSNSHINALKQVTAKTPVPIRTEAFDKIENTQITWLAGAGFFVNCRGTILFIDPLLSTKPGEPWVSEAGLKLKIPYPMVAEAIPRADFVLYTHSDIDHLGPQTALELAKRTPIFIGPHPVYHALTQLGVKPQSIQICRVGDELDLGVLSLEITPADHPWQLQDVARCGKPFRYGDCCGFILNTPDGRLFFPGDTRLMEEHLRIRDIQILALDVSTCEYHLNHTAAAVLANSLPEACLLPLHYGTYDKPEKGAHSGDPEDVFILIENSDKRALRVAPGEIIHLSDGKVRWGEAYI